MKKHLLAPFSFALAVATALVGSVSSTAVAESADVSSQVVLSRGHIDLFEVTFDPTSHLPRLLVKDDTELFSDSVAYRDPADVTVDADNLQAAFEIPEGLDPQFAFLGDAGDTAYLVPEIQDEDLPWPGWSTERLQSTVPDGVTLSSAPDAVKLSLSITGPGDVHTFMSGPFGDVVNHYVDTTDGGPEIIPVGTHNHVHTTWAFTELGTYTMVVTPTVATTEGTDLVGQPSTYTFHIGDPLAPIIPTPIAPGPQIIGTPTVGTELYGADGFWQPSPTEYVGRQWYLDGAPIPGATADHYTPLAEQAGHQLSLRSTVRIGRETAGAFSAPVSVLHPAPTPSIGPALTSAPRVGRVVSANPGTWPVTGLGYGYQWLRDGNPVPGATTASYVPVASDAGKHLAVRVSTSLTGYAPATSTSSAQVVQLGLAPRATVRPKLTGRAKVGRRLHVSRGHWTPAVSSVSYRWKVRGKTIVGKTGPRLRLTRAMRGKRVTVVVTARRPGHLAAVVRITSARVA